MQEVQLLAPASAEKVPTPQWIGAADPAGQYDPAGQMSPVTPSDGVRVAAAELQGEVQAHE